ncbi:MAG: hypothetical protein KatS3mg051_0897 [Anaerolineae bacterium]|nr:MAG: hypothetical protein KatS3mg051_0897 [Anaerolineae bacterium]
MKSDLDRLMAERSIDALLILPGENEDPYRAYLSNGAQHSGLVLKRCGEPPVLIVNSMERDEAARSGLVVYLYDDFGYSELARIHRDDRDVITSTWYGRIFEEFGVGGACRTLRRLRSQQRPAHRAHPGKGAERQSDFRHRGGARYHLRPRL